MGCQSRSWAISEEAHWRRRTRRRTCSSSRLTRRRSGTWCWRRWRLACSVVAAAAGGVADLVDHEATGHHFGRRRRCAAGRHPRLPRSIAEAAARRGWASGGARANLEPAAAAAPGPLHGGCQRDRPALWRVVGPLSEGLAEASPKPRSSPGALEASLDRAGVVGAAHGGVVRGVPGSPNRSRSRRCFCRSGTWASSC